MILIGIPVLSKVRFWARASVVENVEDGSHDAREYWRFTRRLTNEKRVDQVARQYSSPPPLAPTFRL